MEDEEDREVTIGRPAIVEVLRGGNDDEEVPEAGGEVDIIGAREDEEEEERSEDVSDARDVAARSEDAEDEMEEEKRPKLDDADEEIEEETNDEDERPDEDTDVAGAAFGGEGTALAVVEDVKDGDEACEGASEVGDETIDDLVETASLGRL